MIEKEIEGVDFLLEEISSIKEKGTVRGERMRPLNMCVSRVVYSPLHVKPTIVYTHP